MVEEGGTDVSRIQEPERTRKEKSNKETVEIQFLSRRLQFFQGSISAGECGLGEGRDEVGGE